MKLYPLLVSFVKHVNAQDHVLPLLPLQERIVCVKFQEESCFIYLSRQSVHVSVHGEEADTLVLESEEDLHQLVGGMIRLQLLVRHRGAQYNGTYRTMLLLESLFHICKPLELGA